MTRLSSQATGFLRSTLPVVVLIAAVLSSAVLLYYRSQYVIPAAGLFFVYLVWVLPAHRKLAVLYLSEENTLVAIRGESRCTIEVSDIERVDRMRWLRQWPKQIWITLRQGCELGRAIRFIPDPDLPVLSMLSDLVQGRAGAKDAP